jgi:ribonuclease-3
MINYEKIEKAINYTFHDRTLLLQAFTRRSYTAEHTDFKNNEVLEYIGDSVLGMHVTQKMVQRYGHREFDEETLQLLKENSLLMPSVKNWFVSELDESEMSEAKAAMVKKETLAKAISKTGLQKELLVSRGDEKNNVRESLSAMEDLFEAIIGAVTIDSKWDFSATEKVIETLLDPDGFMENGFDDENDYEAMVNEWYTSTYPDKKLIWSIEYDESRTLEYECRIRLGYMMLYRGIKGGGNTENGARRMAARKAWILISKVQKQARDIKNIIGEADYERAINQLQELYQKGYVGEPWYEFSELYDDDGNPVWHCECGVDGEECYFEDDFTSKKYGKKSVAYDMLCYILDREDKDDKT